jgi:trans-2,3-dihydro-3-hydroxyanthranilate isomerase
MSKELAYSVLDVFAERALEGNPLAVFHDARGLTTEQMQAIAREMSLSETTFVLPDDGVDERSAGVRVRIFTTEEELPFAGHPTLGTASWLRQRYAPTQGAETVLLQLNVGPIPVRFDQQQEGPSVHGVMRQNDPVFGVEHDPAEVAHVIGLPAEALLPGFAPQSVSTGNAFCIVALRSVEALAPLAIPQREATAWLRQRQTRWFYVIAPAGEQDGLPVFRARMQFYNGEDPATGSAAGPCVAWLVRRGLLASGQKALLQQGVEMLRPSTLEVRAQTDGERVWDVEVGGRTVSVATGRLFLP